ncbi:hypothetical protein PCASD_23211 [Puccinia coronata f. sp. avenae]|uniref:Uncharacterized protein n=1 Tax=Puccinia coronata f. sp. avenae TaxID=200324 RepID=A0A2N5S521_9BASI|nr:hypothetical protein PCASD_23211 [Puccinia coronata f. sp. avenae]
MFIFACFLSLKPKAGRISHVLWLVAHVVAPPSIWGKGAYEAGDIPGRASLSSNAPGRLQQPSEEYSAWQWDLDPDAALIPNPTFSHVSLDPTLTLPLTLRGKRKQDRWSPSGSPNPSSILSTPSDPRDTSGSTASTPSHVNHDDPPPPAKKHQYQYSDLAEASSSHSTPTSSIMAPPLFPPGFGSRTFSKPNFIALHQIQEDHPWTKAQMSALDESPVMSNTHGVHSQELSRLSSSDIPPTPSQIHEHYPGTGTHLEELSLMSGTHGGHSQKEDKLSSGEISTRKPDSTAPNQVRENHARTDVLDNLPSRSSSHSGQDQEGHGTSSSSELLSQKPVGNRKSAGHQYSMEKEMKSLFSDLKEKYPVFLSDTLNVPTKFLSDNYKEFRQRLSDEHIPGYTSWIQSQRGRFTEQPRNSLNALYTYLIKWTHQLHLHMLNQLDIKTYAYYLQQEKLFHWITNLLFAPLTVLPSRQSQLPSIKVRLFEYLSLEEPDSCGAFLTAYTLVQSFKKSYPEVYSRPPRQLSQSSEEMTSDEEFEKKSANLLQIAIQKRRLENQLDSVEYYRPNSDRLVFKSMDIFNQKCEELRPKFGSRKYSSNHPYLPLRLYPLESSRRPANWGLVRVVMDKGGVVPLDTVNVKLKRLFWAVEDVHIHVVKYLRIRNKESFKCRKEVLDWLIEITLTSRKEHHIPVNGMVRLNQNLAPWDDPSYASQELFSPAQLLLIRFFSLDLTPESLRQHAASLLTSWYQSHSPESFKFLQNLPLPN